jgi:hypothetical protein
MRRATPEMAASAAPREKPTACGPPGIRSRLPRVHGSAVAIEFREERTPATPALRPIAKRVVRIRVLLSGAPSRTVCRLPRGDQVKERRHATMAGGLISEPCALWRLTQSIYRLNNSA